MGLAGYCRYESYLNAVGMIGGAVKLHAFGGDSYLVSRANKVTARNNAARVIALLIDERSDSVAASLLFISIVIADDATKARNVGMTIHAGTSLNGW